MQLLERVLAIEKHEYFSVYRILSSFRYPIYDSMREVAD